MLCCHRNGLCTILNAVFRYSIDCIVRCYVECACTSRHIDRNLAEFASGQVFLNTKILISIFCCHSNGLCRCFSVLPVRYSIDYATRCNSECACTSLRFTSVFHLDKQYLMQYQFRMFCCQRKSLRMLPLI